MCGIFTEKKKKRKKEQTRTEATSNNLCLWEFPVGLVVGLQGGPKVNKIFPRECTGRSKHPLPTTQEKGWLQSVGL